MRIKAVVVKNIRYSCHHIFLWSTVQSETTCLKVFISRAWVPKVKTVKAFVKTSEICHDIRVDASLTLALSSKLFLQSFHFMSTSKTIQMVIKIPKIGFWSQRTIIMIIAWNETRKTWKIIVSRNCHAVSASLEIIRTIDPPGCPLKNWCDCPNIWWNASWYILFAIADSSGMSQYSRVFQHTWVKIIIEKNIPAVFQRSYRTFGCACPCEMRSINCLYERGTSGLTIKAPSIGKTTNKSSFFSSLIYFQRKKRIFFIVPSIWKIFKKPPQNEEAFGKQISITWFHK